MEGIDLVAQLMAMAAVTAPKSKGENFVKTKVLSGADLQKLADEMTAYGQRSGKKDFDRDAGNVANSDAVLLIGIDRAKVLGLNCGACGFADCQGLQEHGRQEGEFAGPVCAFRLLDMGIALGSAVKTASLLNVDNRIMYRIGVAARQMKLADWDLVMGIPLSVSGKNIYFDR